jgi:hypothetical protein
MDQSGVMEASRIPAQSRTKPAPLDACI